LNWERRREASVGVGVVVINLHVVALVLVIFLVFILVGGRRLTTNVLALFIQNLEVGGFLGGSSIGTSHSREAEATDAERGNTELLERVGHHNRWWKPIIRV